MEEKQNTSGLVITLSCRNEELYRLNTANFVENITIGRSEDCAWSVGHVDSTVSNRHAMISQRKKSFYLTDLGSRNGMYLEERKVKEVCLEPGVIVQFGDCALTVTKPGQKNVVKVKPFFLKYIDERGRTVKYKLMPGTIKIGGDEKYNIYLNSGLVSSPHASITRKKDGSCWIRDLNSRNGTQVNHSELMSKNERMLKNGDLISIADTDITFLDSTGAKEGIRLKLALLTLVFTVLVCLGGYFTWQRLTPSSEEYMAQARASARQADFEGARNFLKSAATARHADVTSNERKQLLVRVNTWEHTYRNWSGIQKALNEKDYGAVPQLLGNMELRFVSAWDWNEDDVVRQRNLVGIVKQSFDAMVLLMATSKNNDATEEQLKERVDILDGIIKQYEGHDEPFMLNAKQECSNYRMYGQYTLKGLKELKRLQESIRQEKGPVDIVSAIKTLESLRKDAAPILLSRIEGLLPLFYSIDRAEKTLVERQRLIQEMKFAENAALTFEIQKNTLPMKSLDDKINGLVSRNDELMKTAQNLETYQRVLANEGIVPGQDCETLVSFLDKSVMEKVFGCDCLSGGVPGKSRQKYSGKYDEMVGVEYLYSSLIMMKTYDNVRSRFDIPLESQLEKAASQILLMSIFINYAEENCGTWPMEGALKAYVQYLKKQLSLRDDIVKQVLAGAGKNDRREYFIAHGIALNLNGKLYSYDDRVRLNKEFAEFRLKLQEMNRDYNSAMPEDAIPIREKVIAVGLPGDPVVKRMWSLR